MRSRTLLRVDLPGLPPTVNSMYRTYRRASRTKTLETRKWQEWATAIIASAWGDRPPYEGFVTLEIFLQPQTNGHWDADNRFKALQDCLTPAGVIEDDSQVIRPVAERCLKGDEAITRLVVKTWKMRAL
ncbi:MAG: RusA family crossover junction endodeoxyribonuclease [Synergistaceae bacterium]|nr:RusA family crossover junction endodeoxyribonuclease [Synergistaceae bacterium]